MRLTQHIDNKRCAALDRGQEVASAIDGERNQWRHKAGLPPPALSPSSLFRLLPPFPPSPSPFSFSPPAGAAIDMGSCRLFAGLVGAMGRSKFISGEGLGMGL